MSKPAKTKLLFIVFLLVLFSSQSALADAIPPQPFSLTITYEDKPISDAKFYAVALACGDIRSTEIRSEAPIPQLNIDQFDEDKKCSWMPFAVPESGYCTNQGCDFGPFDYNFKIATYISSLDKVFISNALQRRGGPYYFARYYNLKLNSDGNAVLEESNGSNVIPSTSPLANDFSAGSGISPLAKAFIVTIVLELAVALIFVGLKKIPKRILMAVVVGDIISIPAAWIIAASLLPRGFGIFVAEAFAVLFEAVVIKLFSGHRLTWKMSLLVSFMINLTSFIAGFAFGLL